MNEKLFITRKRKKYKFAKFNEFDNCFQIDEWKAFIEDKEKFFSRKIVLEVGAGTGLLSVEMARRHSDMIFIAVDIKSDRLYSGAKLAQEIGLDNIFFVRSEILDFVETLPDNSINKIWITFPDPHANEEQTRLTNTGNRKRLTSIRYLDLYKNVLKGSLHFKTDNQPLFDWSVDQLKSNGWNIEEQTNDLHQSNIDDEAKIMTTYEKRFVAENLLIYYLSATIDK